MNRSLGYAGVGVVLFGMALVASPIALIGREVLDIEQIAGFLIAPVGLVVVMIAAASFDPEKTTVQGTLGGPAAMAAARREAGELPPAAPLLANPRAPVHCRYCRTIITYDLVRCPRCARDRSCRGCGRPLALREEQAACPGCSRAEFFCNCARQSSAPRSRALGPARYS